MWGGIKKAGCAPGMQAVRYRGALRRDLSARPSCSLGCAAAQGGRCLGSAVITGTLGASEAAAEAEAVPE